MTDLEKLVAHEKDTMKSGYELCLSIIKDINKHLVEQKLTMESAFLSYTINYLTKLEGDIFDDTVSKNEETA